IHRDIKPGNLFLETTAAPAYRVKILDFGLVLSAGADGERTRSGLTLGTRGYMSPEQASGQSIGSGSDMYSLGCVLFRLATGQTPFPDQDPSASPKAWTAKNLPSPRGQRPDLPEGLSRLIECLLARDPRCRLAAHEVLNRLAALTPAAQLSKKS